MSRRAKAERERIKAERRRKKGDDERSNRSDRGAAREARDAKPCQDLAARARFDPKAAERAKPGLGQILNSFARERADYRQRKPIHLLAGGCSGDFFDARATNSSALDRNSLEIGDVAWVLAPEPASNLNSAL